MSRIASSATFPPARRWGVASGLMGLAALGVALSGCFDAGPDDGDDRDFLWDLDECAMEAAFLADGGVGFDRIPAISEPILVSASTSSELGYLAEDHRIIGVVVAGQALAFPLSALWRHEVVNMTYGGTQLLVTHSTLTGASRVHHRSAVEGRDFGISGLLYKNNLILFDRSNAPSLWVQLTGSATCGPRLGITLESYPFVEATWAGWKALHPGTLALSNASASSGSWGLYPYGDYESTQSFYFSSAMPSLDPRRPAKERVLGVPAGQRGGLAFPFGALQEAGAVAVARGEVDGKEVVVFWRNDVKGAAAYWARAGDQALTFFVQDGKVVDQQTGTSWSFQGAGTGGGLAGAQLQAVPEAAVAYWGAWAAFYPDTEIWQAGGGS